MRRCREHCRELATSQRGHDPDPWYLDTILHVDASRRRRGDVSRFVGDRDANGRRWTEHADGNTSSDTIADPNGHANPDDRRRASNGDFDGLPSNRDPEADTFHTPAHFDSDRAISNSDVKRVGLRDANADLIVSNADPVDDAHPANVYPNGDVDVVDGNADVAIFPDGRVNLADADTTAEHPNTNSNRLTPRTGTLANPIRHSNPWWPDHNPYADGDASAIANVHAHGHTQSKSKELTSPALPERRRFGILSDVDNLPVDAIRNDPTLLALIKVADDHLGAQGYTEHGLRHSGLVSHIAENVLRRLGYSEPAPSLAAIAGYLHDVGNVVNRVDHASAGSAFALSYLLGLGMDPTGVGVVAGAIGNHEERIGEPVSSVSAAVIIADKSDVHRTRVRNPDPATFDIHDRVNDASQHSFVRVDPEHRNIALELTIDPAKASVVDYFEIFLSRMLFIRKATRFLGCEFNLAINKTRLL